MNGFHGVFLERDDPDNAEWYEIYNKSVELVERMDKIHIGLKSVRIPKIFPKKFRKDLKEAQKDFPALVPDFNDWWNKAINFTELPHISVTARKDS